MMKVCGLILCTVVLGAATASAAVKRGPLGRLERSVREIRLANGALFLLLNRGASPTVATVLRFAVGGLEEDPGQSGLAHFFEHLAFKGSPRLSAEEIWRAYQRSGGLHLNATTSKDLTTYVVNLPSNRLGLWAWIDAERIFKPLFRDFESERSVVMEERRQRIDNRPVGRLWEAFMGKAFEGSPYAIPTIGTVEDLQGLTIEQAQAFHSRFYRPNRLVGALVGRFDEKRARRWLEDQFGAAQGRAPPIVRPGPWKPQGEERRVVTSGEEGPVLLIGYHKPTLPHRDDYIFDLLAEVLGGGRTSRLYRLLVRSGKVLSVDVDTSIPGARLSNLFVIEANPSQKISLSKTLALIDHEIDSLAQGWIDSSDLDSAKKRIAAHILWSLDDNETIASLLTYYQAVSGDWRYLTQYLDVIETITAEDIQRVVRTYLVPSNRTVGLLKRSS